MKSGVLGLIDGTGNSIDSFEETTESGDDSLTACIEVLQTQTNAVKGNDLQFGRAAIETHTTKDSTSIVNGSITVSEETTIETLYSEFIHVPGQFLVVDNSAGSFVYDLLSNQLPGVDIQRGTIDLNRYLNNVSDWTPWKVGFYGNVGNAEKGTVYGENVLNGGEMGPVLDSCQKNQLGLTLSDGSQEIKCMMTESGYVEIYQPSNFENAEFAEFIAEHILPCAYIE